MMEETLRQSDHEDHLRVLHIVITVQHSAGDCPVERKRHLQDSFHKLTRRKFWKERSHGYSRSLEVEVRGSHGPHPHFHVLGLFRKSDDRPIWDTQTAGWSHSQLLAEAKQMSWWLRGRQIPDYIKRPRNQCEEQKAIDELRKALHQSGHTFPVQVLKWQWFLATGDSYVVWVTDYTDQVLGGASNPFFEVGRSLQIGNERPIESGSIFERVCNYVAKGRKQEGEILYEYSDLQLQQLVATLHGSILQSFSGEFRRVARELGEALDEWEDDALEEQSEADQILNPKHKCPDCGGLCKVVPLDNPDAWMRGADPAKPIPQPYNPDESFSNSDHIGRPEPPWRFRQLHPEEYMPLVGRIDHMRRDAYTKGMWSKLLGSIGNLGVDQ